MRFHTFRATQWVPCELEKMFEFFSDARNLELLTPPFLKFKILTPQPIVLGEGTHIRYKLILHGISIYWLTEIRKWQPPHRFVDTQLSGPYSLWHHTHSFKAENGGTRMNDVVRYRMPFGVLGRIIHAVNVRADVESIFAYRYKTIEERFGK